MAGWLPLFAAAPSGLSKRSTLNVDYTNAPKWVFINHLLAGEQFGVDSHWVSPNPTYPTIIDSSGLPNTSISTAVGMLVGWGVAIPSSLQYGEVGSGHYYVVDFDGNGQFRFDVSPGTITYQAGPVTGPTGSISSSNITAVSGNTWRTTSGANSRFIFNFTGPAQLFPFRFQSNDPNSDGSNVRNVRFYRLDDISDLNAGKVFRTAYKQSIVDLCPSALRFIVWHGGNGCQGGRFRTRMLPSYASYYSQDGIGYDWYNSPAYGAMSFTDASLTANQYTVSAAAGTTGNSKTTPVSMTHLEIATIRSDTTLVRNGAVTVTGVNNSATGKVTAAAHGYNNGDVVFLQFSQVPQTGTFTSGSKTVTTSTTGLVAGMRVSSQFVASGTTIQSIGSGQITLSVNAIGSGFEGAFYQAMPNLQYYPVKVANKTTNDFEIQTLAGVAVNTTSMGTFGGTCVVNQYVTLNIGGRGAYPIVFPQSTFPVGHFGNAYITAGTYNNYIFDKTVSLSSDGAGNQIMGVWRYQEAPAFSIGYDGGGVPLEICTALVNEVNAMSPAHTVHMYINLPYLGMLSMDPDYDANDNWAIGAANVILNGANGYNGLTASANLFMEYANETWNSGFTQTPYLAYRGVCRWLTSGFGDYSSMAVLRSVIAMQDIRGSIYNSSRIKTVLGLQGAQAMDNGGLNQLRVDGTSYVLTDASYPNPLNAPMVYHDHTAFAAYFACPDFDSTGLAALVTSWAAAVASNNTTNQAAAIASYVAALVNTSLANPADTETLWRYTNNVLPPITAKMVTYGKTAIMYEGGWDKPISNIFASSQGTSSYYYLTATLDGTTATITGMDSGVVSAFASSGDFVYGYGIPDLTTVASKPGGGTSLTLSKNTTVAQATYGSIMGMTPTNAFLYAVKGSAQWSAAMLAWFNTFNGTTNGMPADFIQFSYRWGHLAPTSFGYKNAEYTGQDQLFLDEGTRNRALSP